MSYPSAAGPGELVATGLARPDPAVGRRHAYLGGGTSRRPGARFGPQAIRFGAIPVILGGDHTVALPDATGVARQVG